MNSSTFSTANPFLSTMITVPSGRSTHALNANRRSQRMAEASTTRVPRRERTISTACRRTRPQISVPVRTRASGARLIVGLRGLREIEDRRRWILERDREDFVHAPDAQDLHLALHFLGHVDQILHVALGNDHALDAGAVRS